jgi:hypothetical protein
MSDTPLERLLGTDARDPGCEAAFAVLDEYVDAIRRGDDVRESFAGLLTHIRNCPACREDAEGLLAAANDLEPPPVK